MRKSIFSLLCFFCCAVTLLAQSKLVTATMKSRILGCEKYYNVYLPDGYDSSSEDYPVLYLLHGLFENHQAWAKIGVQYVADSMIQSGACVPMVIVMPDASGENVRHAGRHTGYNNQPGWNYEDFFVKEFIPTMEKRYRIKADKQHRAIAGLSMGGHGSMLFASSHPHLFSTAFLMSARLSGESVVTEHRDEAYCKELRDNDFVRNFPTYSPQKIEAMKTVRWFFDCGDDDGLLGGSLDLYRCMRAAGFNAELRVRNGAHNNLYWRYSLPIALRYITAGIKE